MDTDTFISDNWQKIGWTAERSENRGCGNEAVTGRRRKLLSMSGARGRRAVTEHVRPESDAHWLLKLILSIQCHFNVHIVLL